jgi:dTDP-4-amino-4,6-dideoxygalactose transaminase
VPSWIVPLADVRLSDDEVEAVAAVYRSGWLSQGPRVAEFEAAFARHAGVSSDAAVALSSGTAALELACVLTGVSPGDEVVLPSLTFAATAAAVLRAGATPVFADIDAVSRPWLSSGAVERALSPRTRAIMNVAYGGHPGDVTALRELADARGLWLIEDAAHAVGGWDGGRHAGTVGHLGTFSFFANKNLPLGEGGMLVTADPQLARRARSLRSHGLSAGTWARHRGDPQDYDVIEPGFNFRLDEPRAALGCALLSRLGADVRHRSELAISYARAFDSIAGVRPAIQAGPAVRCAWHIYPLVLDAGLDRGRFRGLLAEQGIQTSVHYPPLHLTTAFARFAEDPLPLTEDYGRRTATVPLFGHMTEVQQRRVVDAVRAALDALTR